MEGSEQLSTVNHPRDKNTRKRQLFYFIFSSTSDRPVTSSRMQASFPSGRLIVTPAKVLDRSIRSPIHVGRPIEICRLSTPKGVIIAQTNQRVAHGNGCYVDQSGDYTYVIMSRLREKCELISN
jgi:hypothetical protein